MIVHIDAFHNLIKVYDCARDAERELGVWTSKILNVCHEKQKHTGGLFFMFYEDYEENKHKLIGKEIKTTPYRRKVIQKTLDGKFIAEYPTIKMASEAVNVDTSCIINVCKGRKQETAAGFLWEYA